MEAPGVLYTGDETIQPSHVIDTEAMIEVHIKVLKRWIINFGHVGFIVGECII
jgi:hypothetical protein